MTWEAIFTQNSIQNAYLEDTLIASASVTVRRSAFAQENEKLRVERAHLKTMGGLLFGNQWSRLTWGH
jgi:hypothetical protein